MKLNVEDRYVNLVNTILNSVGQEYVIAVAVLLNQKLQLNQKNV